MVEVDSFTFRVTDLKQYVYCPRILYYHTVLPAVRPTTYKMEAGIQAHVAVEGLERRRSLRAYGLEAGTRIFNVPLTAPSLLLTGELDMLVDTETELIPVDYKLAKQAGAHFRLQLMAYGRLLEETRPGKAVRRGFLYLVPIRKAVPVSFTSSLRRQLTQALAEMQAIACQQRHPAPTARRRRCLNCEFRRFCNDVL